MANWSLLRMAWALKSKLKSLEMSAIDLFLSKVPNFAEGSAHTTTGEVFLDGAPGLRVTTLTINTGSGSATWESGATAELLSGAVAHWQNGSTATFDDDVDVFDNTTHWTTTGVHNWASGSFSIFLSGSLQKMQNGSFVWWTTGSVLQVDSGCTVALNLNSASTLSRSCASMKSGNLAADDHRHVEGTDSNMTIVGSRQETLSIAALTTADRTLVISPPDDPTVRCRLHIHWHHQGSGPVAGLGLSILGPTKVASTKNITITAGSVNLPWFHNSTTFLMYSVLLEWLPAPVSDWSVLNLKSDVS